METLKEVWVRNLGLVRQSECQAVTACMLPSPYAVWQERSTCIGLLAPCFVSQIAFAIAFDDLHSISRPCLEQTSARSTSRRHPTLNAQVRQQERRQWFDTAAACDDLGMSLTHDTSRAEAITARPQPPSHVVSRCMGRV